MSVDFPPTKISKENSQVYIDSNGYVYIKLSGVDDFKFEPNKFIALSGSVIETDTINETTTDAGVTIESVKLEDGDINTTQITIGANTLDTDEWAYLDGLDQALKTTDSVVFGSAKISDLTSGRILIAGASGEIQDDADLTFSTDTLTVTKIGAFEAAGAINFADQNMTNVNIDSGTVDGITSLTVANNVDIGNYDIRALSGTFDSLTSGRVPFASTNGKLVDDSGFTFATDTLTVTKIVIGTSATLASAAVSDLTSGRVVIAGTNGELQDDADLTFDTDTLTVTKIAAFELTGKLTAGSTEIEGSNFDINGGTVDGITSLTVANDIDIGNYNIRALSGTFDSLTSGRIPIVSTDGLLVDDSDLTFDDDTLTATKTVSTVKTTHQLSTYSISAAYQSGYTANIRGVSNDWSI